MIKWAPIDLARVMRIEEMHDEDGEAVRVDLWVRDTLVRPDGSTYTTSGVRYVNCYWFQRSFEEPSDGEWRDEGHNRIEGMIHGGQRKVTHFTFIEEPDAVGKEEELA
jgi:hypothetical protein